ncbi:MAG: hypothetical protein BRD37_06340 [Bacteroidetes bacterium QH_8_67_23]|nr:MAG: hypothetical protein BRD37_06340 [Bacteroidetes bacterium QH_8_67_23]
MTKRNGPPRKPDREPSTLTCSPNPQTAVQNVIVFVLSAFLGNEILSKVPTWLGFFALVVAMINVVGGFLVTDRMLQMFARRQKPPAASEKSQEGAKTPVQ